MKQDQLFELLVELTVENKELRKNLKKEEENSSYWYYRALKAEGYNVENTLEKTTQP